VLLGNGDGTFQTTNFSYVADTSTSVAVADFSGDGLPDLQTTNFNYVAGTSTSVAVADFSGDGLSDLAVTDFVSNSVFILANDGIWNGPAPRPGRTPGLTFAPLPAALPPHQLPEARWYKVLPPVDLPTTPLPHQPLLDWLWSAPIQPETAALPLAVPWSREAWDAFFVAAVFDLGDWDLAPLRSPPWTT
jgi:hypothetical protein